MATPVDMFARIVVAIDGSPSADHALATAVEIARKFSSELTLITVLAPYVPIYPMAGAIPPILEDVRDDSQKMLDARAGPLRALGLRNVKSEVLEGPVVDSIVAYLREGGADLVVLGARGLSLGARLFLGSVSEGVVTHARIPVLVVHDSASSKAAEISSSPASTAVGGTTPTPSKSA
jgi:nucleotide-binding universal stress UspA family protein